MNEKPQDEVTRPLDEIVIPFIFRVFVHSHFESHNPIEISFSQLAGKFDADFLEWLFAQEQVVLLDVFEGLETEQWYDCTMEIECDENQWHIGIIDAVKV